MPCASTVKLASDGSNVVQFGNSACVFVKMIPSVPRSATELGRLRKFGGLDAPWGNRRWKSAVVYDNDPGWGLWNAPAQSVRDGLYYLEFTLVAVPPLVALRRVVLPASRHARRAGLN